MSQRRYLKTKLVDQPSCQSSTNAVRCCAHPLGAWPQKRYDGRLLWINLLFLMR